MNKSKRFFCALLACMTAWSAACANGEDAVPTLEPNVTAAPTEAPTETPTEAPTAEPTSEPTAEPTETPSAEPTGEPTNEPTTEPEPTAGPSAEPTGEPTTEPTSEPTTGPTAGPSAEPTVRPENWLEITPSGDAQLMQDVWQISAQMPQAQIEFGWLPVEGATLYEIRITDSQGAEIHLSQSAEPGLVLPAADLGTETYLLIVTAWQVQEAEPEPVQLLVKQGEIRFALVQGMQPGGFPGDFPGGFGGGRPSGNFSGAMPGGEMPGEEQGFRVTPGEALTDSHASGTKDMRLYGSVNPEAQQEAMTVLTLDGVELDVSLDGQTSAFFAACEDGVLILTPEGEGKAWSVGAFALKTLGKSGIETVRLMFGEEYVELSTRRQLQGAEYAKLCAAGYVSKDYTLTVYLEDTLVSVAEKVYTINEKNELVGG